MWPSQENRCWWSGGRHRSRTQGGNNERCRDQPRFALAGSRTEFKIMCLRSLATVCLFGAAAVMALKYPLVGLGICICCLIAYLRAKPSSADRATDTR